MGDLDEASGPAEDEAEATLKLLERAPELYQRQSHEERARFLNVLLSNSVLVDRKLDPFYKTPSTWSPKGCPVLIG